MIQTRKMLAKLAVDTMIGLVFSFFFIIMLPEISAGGRWIAAAVMFFMAGTSASLVVRELWQRLEHRAFKVRDSRLMIQFIDRLRFSYTIDDLMESISTVLEHDADSSVLYVNAENNYVIYNSPTRIATDPDTLEVLSRNFPENWPEGFYLIDEKLGLVSDFQNARGFFLVYGKLHFYVLCRYMKVFERSVFDTMFYEFVNFQKRTKTITQLTAISELSKEWDMVAETQMSFLPQNMPEIPHLDIAAYFRPLVNVSGDFYDVIPLDENRTFFLLGDVSGKGLASALIMGVISNTVKIIDNKEDLPGVIRAIDTAIKSMHLQDKYAVLFIGIIDTKVMKIRYVNASMADPIIITRAPGGYKIKPLQSTCSLVGIIDLDEIVQEEAPLYRGDVVLMASDGVSEVMDESGVELGDTELYMNTVRNSAHKTARHFVNDIADLVMEYNGDKKLRDDVTMLVAKIEE
ncbi:MAG TPA: SpoIIE family protein phosphatase [Treponemataceae bacterium]|jgi:serine phosphatase RsbU (regulator of sigma subunit)|nr:SpoIIE family protein phosphatase [Treponemataceae bacterium]HOS34668.1 SpoIIE family protein phosphatase [Treponemataceae bacterium]HOU37319.1 SpoIIE family protein phosphatase [Treponemataceae bacterium]HPL90810.1 SpoIIE family protein phosphatase [Treponemataceae bacterium]HPX13251.1 SpoIIE family protein phosphatase [Treponemataceae bacterium]